MDHLPIKDEVFTSQWALQVAHVIRDGERIDLDWGGAKVMLCILEFGASTHVPCDITDRGTWAWLEGFECLFGFMLELLVDVDRPDRVSCQDIWLADRLQAGECKTYLIQAGARRRIVAHSRSPGPPTNKNPTAC